MQGALESQIKQERERARALRRSRWWANLTAQGRCYYCQAPITRATATMDHIVPLAQGGRSIPGNVVPACKPCNIKKRDQSAVEWILNGDMSQSLNQTAAAQFEKEGDHDQK